MIFAKKQFGQNFLVDQSILSKIVKELYQAENIIEIGPGTGNLTSHLIKLPKLKNLILIEIDHDLVKILKIKFCLEKNISIINQDFLKLNLSNLIKPNTALVGNLPYNIGTQIILNIINSAKDLRPNKIVFMLQKEVVNRIIANPNSKAYGKFSIFCQLSTEPKLLFTVPPTAFRPSPKVDSAVFSMVFHNKYNELTKQQIIKLVSIAFRQKRKTLANNLKNIINKNMITEFNLNKLRGENFSIDDFLKLNQALIKK